jgi:hypothetical protein
VSINIIVAIAGVWSNRLVLYISIELFERFRKNVFMSSFSNFAEFTVFPTASVV